MVSEAEQVLGFSISFIKCLLENPSIWVSDRILSEREEDENEDIENYLEQNFFLKDRILNMFKVCVTKYIVLTSEEIELWKEDSLKYFLHMKYLSNEVKGNFLREKAKGLIAAIRLRFEPMFDEFCGLLNSELLGVYSNEGLTF